MRGTTIDRARWESDRSRGARVIRWTTWVPVLTLVIFGSLTVLSFHEGRRPSPAPIRHAEPVSEAVRARYVRESKDFAARRAAARDGLSVAGIVRALEGERPEDIPLVTKLVSDANALAKREEDAPAKLAGALVSFLARSQDDEVPIRLERAEGLVSQVVFSIPGECPGMRMPRDDLLAAIQRTVRRRSPAAAALLQLLPAAEPAPELARLEAIRSEVEGAQLAHEFDRAIEALKVRERRGTREDSGP